MMGEPKNYSVRRSSAAEHREKAEWGFESPDEYREGNSHAGMASAHESSAEVGSSNLSGATLIVPMARRTGLPSRAAGIRRVEVNGVSVYDSGLPRR